MAEYYSIVYMYHGFFICTYVAGHLGCFHVLSIVNSTVVNTGEHGSFSISVSSVYMPSSGISGSYGGFGEGNGNPFQYSCLGNPIDRGAWRAIVHSVAELDTTKAI